jgi:hypothetical protein
MYSNVALIGRQYEQSLRTKLKSVFKRIPKTAGFGTGADLTIPFPSNPRQNLLVEVKTSTGADFGQKAVTFDGRSWIPKITGQEPLEIVELYNQLFTQYNVGQKITELWKLPNESITSEDLRQIVTDDSMSKILFYEKLLSESTGQDNPFPTKKIASGKDVISNIIKYYNSKGINYIQIRGSGFYIMGKDIANLNKILGIKIPQFNPSSADLIIRGKPSKTQKTFRPTLTLKSATVQSSKYNLDNRSFINLLYNNL